MMLIVELCALLEQRDYSHYDRERKAPETRLSQLASSTIRQLQNEMSMVKCATLAFILCWFRHFPIAA